VRACDLKRWYPNVWAVVESGVIEDMRQCMPQAMVEMSVSDDVRHCRIHRVAHNAAFLAVSELHKARPKGKRGEHKTNYQQPQPNSTAVSE